MEEYKVSIIIPAYNVEKFIYACLDSIKKQTYDNYEIIVINDGSTDNTQTEIEKFISNNKDVNIKAIFQINSGVSATRNKGIAEAKGNYICFIDSDDLLESNYLLSHVKNLKKYDCDVSICNNEVISESSLLENISIYATNNKEFIYDNNTCLRKLLYGEIKTGIWGIVCKKDFLEIIKFDENTAYGEDLEMVYKICGLGEKIVYTTQKHYYYRKRSNSAMSIVDDRRKQGQELFKKLGDFFEIHAQDFNQKFKKYGVARYTWGIIWQIAVSCKTYELFKKNIAQYEPKKYFKDLFTFPILKVRASSILFFYFPRLYYLFFRFCKFLLKREIRRN